MCLTFWVQFTIPGVVLLASSVVQDVHVDVAVYAVDVSGAACLPQHVRTFVVGLVREVGKPYRPYIGIIPDLFKVVFASCYIKIFLFFIALITIWNYTEY